jgi:hypothetical protein
MPAGFSNQHLNQQPKKNGTVSGPVLLREQFLITASSYTSP